MIMNDEGRLWSRREIAEHHRWSEKTVDNYRRRGLLKPIRIGKRSIRFADKNVAALREIRP